MIQEINDKGECFASKKNNFVKKDVSAVYLKHLNCIIIVAYLFIKTHHEIKIIFPWFSSSFLRDRDQSGGDIFVFPSKPLFGNVAHIVRFALSPFFW